VQFIIKGLYTFEELFKMISLALCSLQRDGAEARLNPERFSRLSWWHLGFGCCLSIRTRATGLQPRASAPAAYPLVPPGRQDLLSSPINSPPELCWLVCPTPGEVASKPLSHVRGLVFLARLNKARWSLRRRESN